MGEHPEPHPARGEGGVARLLLRQHPQELLPGPQGSVGKKTRFFFLNPAQCYFLGFFWIFFDFLGFLFFFAQERAILGFFQFQEYF